MKSEGIGFGKVISGLLKNQQIAAAAKANCLEYFVNSLV